MLLIYCYYCIYIRNKNNLIKKVEKHIQKNNCKNIVTKTGELSVSEKNQFEIILANINRTIILGSLKSLYNMLADDGDILFSGIMNVDKAMVIAAAEKEGFILKKKYYLNEWICIHFGK